jgi:hypothetical protein
MRRANRLHEAGIHKPHAQILANRQLSDEYSEFLRNHPPVHFDNIDEHFLALGDALFDTISAIAQLYSKLLYMILTSITEAIPIRSPHVRICVKFPSVPVQSWRRCHGSPVNIRALHRPHDATDLGHFSAKVSRRSIR